jgi:hypothetical protein
MARKKRLLTLAKELDFTEEHEYFDYMIDSHINGNFTQCKELFKDLNIEDKKRALIYIDNAGFKREFKFYLGLM